MTALTLMVEYIPGDIVYLKTDPDQIVRMVYALKYDIDEKVSYLLCHSDNEPTEHSPREISPLKNYNFESSARKEEEED